MDRDKSGRMAIKLQLHTIYGTDLEEKKEKSHLPC